MSASDEAVRVWEAERGLLYQTFPLKNILSLHGSHPRLVVASFPGGSEVLNITSSDPTLRDLPFVPQSDLNDTLASASQAAWVPTSIRLEGPKVSS